MDEVEFEVDPKGFTDKQLKVYKRVFDHFQKDGHVSGRDVFVKALKHAGIVPAFDQIEPMLSDMPNRDRITAVDFLIVVFYHLRGLETTEELIRAFAVFDPGGTGMVSTEAATSILNSQRRQLGQERIAELIRDLEHEGEIDYREMVRKIKTS
jgi:Ca2+-binding EF-hand superfamily protein